MNIHKIKMSAIPKIAVIATGLAVAVMAATIHPIPAQATPRAGNQEVDTERRRREVEHGDIGLQLLCQTDSLLAISGFGDHL